MVNRMYLRKSDVGVFGESAAEPAVTVEVKTVEGDPQLIDDSEFYHQLLKEFLESCDGASESAFYALRKKQHKKRKLVDRRASKSRKIRYNVHEKLANFMAPVPITVPLMASKLFENLFGMGIATAAEAELQQLAAAGQRSDELAARTVGCLEQIVWHVVAASRDLRGTSPVNLLSLKLQGCEIGEIENEVRGSDASESPMNQLLASLKSSMAGNLLPVWAGMLPCSWFPSTGKTLSGGTDCTSRAGGRHAQG
ncbi:hypothetical protein QYE76_034552 [Lolium multiflorum]|uniref:Apoptosis-antagonizing transcription factor C-terminal domain-containing protein n=1 Tax=Lolium multiflorum TaxID=4521 RepID=A0AAD8VLC3_LOLMU|nr:hypothetical protein QYE76_034552 [Lolium multiflorum]